MRAVVLALQGDVSEHLHALDAAMKALGIRGTAVAAKRPKELENADALLIPGGESTTISKQLDRFNLRLPVLDFAGAGKPVMGTCAGTILLSKEIVDQKGQRVEPLGIMDISVRRNAFGRQADSFERDIMVDGLETAFHGVFIRAPTIERAGPQVRTLATLDRKHVMVKQGNALALTFHPELASDPRIHTMFLGMVRT